MTGNLETWDRFADIDPAFTKTITGKDYKGTSPNPHYVIQCLTEMFGPVGQGFGWNVIAEDIQSFGDTTVHWCRISFWHNDRANTFEAYGQTKMSYMTRGNSPYLKVDEDAPKKSLTDAITKAASQIGVAAGIFLGRWDDSKYVAEVNAEYRADENPPFDAVACRDRIKLAVSKQSTDEDLNALWGAEKGAMSALKAADQPKYLEVETAFKEAKSKFVKDQ